MNITEVCLGVAYLKLLVLPVALGKAEIDVQFYNIPSAKGDSGSDVSCDGDLRSRRMINKDHIPGSSHVRRNNRLLQDRCCQRRSEKTNPTLQTLPAGTSDTNRNQRISVCTEASWSSSTICFSCFNCSSYKNWMRQLASLGRVIRTMIQGPYGSCVRRSLEGKCAHIVLDEICKPEQSRSVRSQRKTPGAFPVHTGVTAMFEGPKACAL